MYSPNADFELMGLNKYNHVEQVDDDGSIAPLKIASVPIRSIADIAKDAIIGIYISPLLSPSLPFSLPLFFIITYCVLDVIGVVMHVGDRIEAKSQRTSESTTSNPPHFLSLLLFSLHYFSFLFSSLLFCLLFIHCFYFSAKSGVNRGYKWGIRGSHVVACEGC